MKRIDFICKNVNGVLAEGFSFREKRVRRTLSDAIDDVNELIYESKRKAEEAINTIKDVVDDKSKIQDKLNSYIDYMSDVDGYTKSREYLERVMEMLDEEVDVELEDEKKEK